LTPEAETNADDNPLIGRLMPRKRTTFSLGRIGHFWPVPVMTAALKQFLGRLDQSDPAAWLGSDWGIMGGGVDARNRRYSVAKLVSSAKSRRDAKQWSKITGILDSILLLEVDWGDYCAQIRRPEFCNRIGGISDTSGLIFRTARVFQNSQVASLRATRRAQ
jgi:hypothetical protein